MHFHRPENLTEAHGIVQKRSEADCAPVVVSAKFQVQRTAREGSPRPVRGLFTKIGFLRTGVSVHKWRVTHLRGLSVATCGLCDHLDVTPQS